MGKTTITCENKISRFSCNLNGSVSGGVSVETCGRIGTLSGTLRYPSAGISLMLAAFPSDKTQYAPGADINLSCDFYSRDVSAEAFLNSSGQILVNQPAGDYILKISGTWIIDGEI